MTRTMLCAAFAASVFLGATAAAAHAEDGEIRVRVGDLDLASSDGAEDALERIENKVEVFCEAGAGRLTLQRVQASDRCVADLTRRSVRQLDAPMVTALYEYSTPVLLAQR
jgi:UrcA family protein